MSIREGGNVFQPGKHQHKIKQLQTGYRYILIGNQVMIYPKQRSEVLVGARPWKERSVSTLGGWVFSGKLFSARRVTWEDQGSHRFIDS